MALLVDTFWDQAQTRLIANGWVLLNVSRYDPTHVDGLTPTGKAFTLDAIDSVINLTIAGRTRTVNRAKALWEPGDAAVQGIIDARNAFPVSQR